MEPELKLVVSATIIFVLFIGAVNIMHLNLATGTGKQAGYISEVERSGIFWKPPEVKLISIVPTYSSSDTVWYFGASNEMANLAEQYSQNNTKVVVKYHTEHHVWSWEYSSVTIIDSIEPIKE